MTDTNVKSTKPRSKRLRKKLYVDEFAIVGFEFTGKFNTDAAAELDAFFDGLLTLIGERNLSIGGGSSSEFFEAYVSSGERYGNTSEEDRAAVEAWLKGQSVIDEVTVEPMSDAVYGE